MGEDVFARLRNKTYVTRQAAMCLLGVSYGEINKLIALKHLSSCNRIKIDQLRAVAKLMAEGWTIPKRVVTPRGDVGPQHLYVLEFVGRSVKVGISVQPTVRMGKHVDQARLFGCEVGRSWVSYRHREARQNEATIQGCSPREYLARPFEDVVEQALALPMTRAEVSCG